MSKLLQLWLTETLHNGLKITKSKNATSKNKGSISREVIEALMLWHKTSNPPLIKVPEKKKIVGISYGPEHADLFKHSGPVPFQVIVRSACAYYIDQKLNKKEKQSLEPYESE